MLNADGARMERIASRAVTDGEWYEQPWPEFVLLVEDAAMLEFADGIRHALAPGDGAVLSAGCRYRMAWTDPEAETPWLAVHLIGLKPRGFTGAAVPPAHGFLEEQAAIPTPIIVAIMFAYIGLGGLMMGLTEQLVPYGSRGNIAVLIALVWVAGWIWLIGALALGSARGGIELLRWWVAAMGGMAIVAVPMALLPHPGPIFAGVIGGVAFASWVSSGKAHGLHKK